MISRKHFLRILGLGALISGSPKLLALQGPKEPEFDSFKSFEITRKKGRKVFGWYDRNMQYYYEYGTSGVIVRPEEILSMREVTWHEAVANLDDRGLAPKYIDQWEILPP